MSPVQQTTIPTAAVRETSLAREHRRELLRLLLLARGLERTISGARGGLQTADLGGREAVLTAVAASSAAAPNDRLVAPHAWLAAHLASGARPAEIFAARARAPRGSRSGRPLWPGVGPQSSTGIGVGIALAIALGRSGGASDAVLALVDRRWRDDRAHSDAVSLARELSLPLVVVSIDPSSVPERGDRVVDRTDYEAVVATVATALGAAREHRRPALVECTAVAAPEMAAAGRMSRFAGKADPVAGYERRLMIGGFSRTELEEIERAAATELRRSLGTRGR
jgi:TPP-dependent pyruvate/acetoin dehydrogenase alpha subunit